MVREDVRILQEYVGKVRQVIESSGHRGLEDLQEKREVEVEDEDMNGGVCKIVSAKT
jgi:hypothetical protein